MPRRPRASANSHRRRRGHYRGAHRKLFKKNGYEVAGIAESSEEALAGIRVLKPDLILMDIRIKGSMDGIETTAKLQESFDMPVIYLTAHNDRQTIDRAKRSGAFGFLTKPIRQSALGAGIEAAILKHRTGRAADRSPTSCRNRRNRR